MTCCYRLFFCVFIVASLLFCDNAHAIFCRDLDLNGVNDFQKSVGPNNPFVFPASIDRIFQQELQNNGLSLRSIQNLNKTGLGFYDADFDSTHSLFNDLNGNLTRLDIFKIYKSAKNAVNLAKVKSTEQLNSIWSIINAIEFHEVLHQANHGYRWVLEPFEKILGDLSEKSFAVLAESLRESYSQLDSSFNHYLYDRQSPAYREFMLEELWVLLLWEEALFKNGHVVIQNLNRSLLNKGIEPISELQLLEYVKKNLIGYEEEVQLVLNAPKYFADGVKKYGVQLNANIEESVQRIINPVSSKMLSVHDVESIEMGSIFNRFGYMKISPQGIRNPRLMQPIYNDNQEIQTRVAAQKDLAEARCFGMSKSLSQMLEAWLMGSVSRQPELGWGKKTLSLLQGEVVDYEYWRRYLKLDANESLSEADLKGLVYLDVTGLFHDMIKLYRLISNSQKVRSDRVKALRWITQSVIDPQHPFGLQKYYEALINGESQVQEQMLKELLIEKPFELDKLLRVYEEVALLLDLETLGRSIQGTTFANLIDPKEYDKPLLKIATAHNPALMNQQKSNSKPSVPNSLVPSHDASENFALGGRTEKSGLLVYGENENGKSTYLRTIAQLIHLALIGARLPVVSMDLTPMPVYTALNSQDSLAKGVSHHAADIESINRVVRQVQANPFALVLVDELATGTIQEAGNATEAAYLDWFINQGALTILSTHRLGTFEMAQVNQQLLVVTANNYVLTTGQPDREKLIEGGIKTLENHGTPDEIIQRARQIIKNRPK